MKNLAKAIIAVMKEVSNIEKSMTVGAGTKGAYKGVSDKDVKNIVGKAMAKNGLCIMPIKVDAKTQIDRWEEEDAWSKAVPKEKKTKQSVFVETTCEYLLLHESGESQVIAGYGNGVDSQDKAAGKATTYSLKNDLLYTFMIPTGDIEDTDKTHSDDIPVPKVVVAKQSAEPSTEAKVAQMNNTTPPKELTAEELKVHEDAINLIGQATGIAGYYNALPTDLQANKTIQGYLSARREAIKVKV